MRIAIAQINPWLGNFSYNAEKIIEFTKKASELKAHICVFPEMSLLGYPPYDLLERSDLLKLQEKEIIKIKKNIPKNILVIFGALLKDAPYKNVAVILQKNQKPQFVAKQLLPSYDIFDETRFFKPGEHTYIKKFSGVGKLAITVCEDMWADFQGYNNDPFKKIKNVDAIINISASPFSYVKHQRRLQVAQKHVKKIKAPFIYINQVGAQDELIFDGRSFILDKKGRLIAQAQEFKEDLVVVDLKNKNTIVKPNLDNKTELIKKALVLGIKDFFFKTNQQKAHLGLSGGIDSAVTACLAVEALGKENVVGVLMPGPYSSQHSVDDALELAKNLNIKTITYNINEAFEVFNKQKAVLSKNITNDIAVQNLQARLRAITLMFYSNLEQSILLSTSNKAELAAGYSTLYGDSCGGLAPIGDLLKKDIYDLAKCINKNAVIIPLNSISKAPSAELAPNQKDQDSLPPYEELDQAVVQIVENKREAKNKTEQWLEKALKISEFKRWQAPPILRISEHAFGRGRRFPIAYKLDSKSN